MDKSFLIVLVVAAALFVGCTSAPQGQPTATPGASLMPTATMQATASPQATVSAIPTAAPTANSFSGCTGFTKFKCNSFTLTRTVTEVEVENTMGISVIIRNLAISRPDGVEVTYRDFGDILLTPGSAIVVTGNQTYSQEGAYNVRITVTYSDPKTQLLNTDIGYVSGSFSG